MATDQGIAGSHTVSRSSSRAVHPISEILRLKPSLKEIVRAVFVRHVLALVVSYVFPLFLSFSLSLSYAVHKVYY